MEAPLPALCTEQSCRLAALQNAPSLPTRFCADRSQPADVGLCAQDPACPRSCTVTKAQFWSSYRMNVTELNPLGSSFRLLDITMQAISEFCPLEEEGGKAGLDRPLGALQKLQAHPRPSPNLRCTQHR